MSASLRLPLDVHISVAIGVLRKKHFSFGNAVAVAHRTALFPRETFKPKCAFTAIPLDRAAVAVAYTDEDQKVSSSPASVLYLRRYHDPWTHSRGRELDNYGMSSKVVSKMTHLFRAPVLSFSEHTRHF